jgi:hypothetical protein
MALAEECTSLISETVSTGVGEMNEDTFDDRLEKAFRLPEDGFPWPEIGDKLFSRGQPTSAAWLARHTDDRFYHMTEGYQLAGDLLVEQAEAGGWSARRKLVYPIVFCYRHFLELTLKAILEKYGSMVNIEPNRSGHTLEGLWMDFRRLLRDLDAEGGPGDEQATEVVGQCVAEFAKMDPSSQTFRYPTSKRGQPFELDLDSIDLPQLHDTIEKIDTYFTCLDASLDQIKEAREDTAVMLAELYPTNYY